MKKLDKVIVTSATMGIVKLKNASQIINKIVRFRFLHAHVTCCHSENALERNSR